MEEKDDQPLESGIKDKPIKENPQPPPVTNSSANEKRAEQTNFCRIRFLELQNNLSRNNP